jgi:uncharacterized delta-60 repeat protein
MEGRAAVLDGANRLVIVGLAAPLQISSPGRLAAARVLSDGSMDATFASGGLFTLALPQYNSLWASAVAMDSQGRIVAGGAAQSSLFGQGGFFALRLTTAGALDPILDGIGYRVVGLSGYAAAFGATSVAIGAGDAILLAGQDDPFANPFAIVRLTASGSFDGTFGTAGVVHLSETGSMVLDTAGRVVIAITGGDSTTSEIALRRLTIAGAMDASFGNAGLLKVSLAASVSTPSLQGIAVDSAGRMVLSTWGIGATGGAAAVTRVSAAGQPDASFGIGGTRVVDAPSLTSNWPLPVGIGPTNDVALAGNTYFGPSTMIARLDASGGLVTAFDGDGVAGIDPGTRRLTLTSLVRQSDGKLVLAGFATEPSIGEANFIVARLTTLGALDPTFATRGFRLITVNNVYSTGDVLAALDPSGRIVLATHDFSGNFIVLRLLADGSTDAAFNSGRAATLVDSPTNSSVTQAGLAVDAGGNIVLAGGNVLRLKADGEADTHFGVGGRVPVPLSAPNNTRVALAVDATGRPVLAGQTSNSPDLAVARLTTSGVLDAAFGSAGIAHVALDSTLPSVFPGPLAIDGAGRIVVAAIAMDSQHVRGFVARLDAAGGLDASFNATGIASYDPTAGQARTMVVDPGNAVVLTGGGWSTRLLSNGLVDNTLNAGFGLTTFVPAAGALGTNSVVADATGIYVGGVAQRTLVVVKLMDGTPTKLAFVRINGFQQPVAATPMDIAIGAVDGLGNPQPVTAATTVALRRDDDVDIFIGTKSCVIPKGQSACVVSGALLPTSGYMGFKAFVASGPTLAPALQPSGYVTTAQAKLSIVTHVPEPSNVLAPITVSFSITGASSIAPTGYVGIGDGVSSCSVALPQTSCTLAPRTAGTRMLVAQYNGDLAYGFATSLPVSHVVNPLVQVSLPAQGGSTVMSFTGGGAGCTFTSASFIAVPSWAPLPPGTSLPFGAIDFRIEGCTPRSTVHMSVTYPTAPPSIAQFIFHDWNYLIPIYPAVPTSINGNVVTFDITDGTSPDVFPDGTIWGIGGAAISRDVAVDANAQAAQAIPVHGKPWLALLVLCICAVAAQLSRAARAR